MFSSLLMINSSIAQNNPSNLSELNKILAANQADNNASQPEAPAPESKVVVPLGKNSKPLNTPAATDGADYESNIFTGLDDYNNRKKLLAERAAEIKKERERREEEYRRQAYEKALIAAQERERKRIAEANKAKGGKQMSNQDYFDRQTKIMQGQK